MDEKAFRITEGRGFKMTFDNGVTISVQFGPYNYCDHYHTDFGDDPRKAQQECGASGSYTAEVGAWYNDGTWIPLGGADDVVGYQYVNDVLSIMNKLSKLPRNGYVELKKIKTTIQELKNSDNYEMANIIENLIKLV